MPADEFDERLAGCCFQLLKPQKSRVLVYRAQIRALQRTIEPRTKVNARFVKAGDQDRDNDDQADKSDPPENPFADGRLKDLWDQGLEANNRYWLIRQLVRDGERQLLPQWGLPISITECSIDEGKRLC